MTSMPLLCKLVRAMEGWHMHHTNRDTLDHVKGKGYSGCLQWVLNALLFKWVRKAQ